MVDLMCEELPRGDLLVATMDPMGVEDRFEAHRHPFHQLAWASSGMLEVQVEHEVWMLPPSLALWIPADVDHAVGVRRPSLLEGVYFRPHAVPFGDGDWRRPTLVRMTSLLRDLLGHLREPDLSAAARSRAEQVVLDLVRPASERPIEVPLPDDDRARAVAHALLVDPGDGRSLEEWGHEVGASARTLARLFATETGLTFGQWRTQVRLRAALGQLAAGHRVVEVARAVGYSTPDGFVAAFRKVVGNSPSSYLAASAG